MIFPTRQPSGSGIWMEITPRGKRHSPLSPAVRLRRFRHDLRSLIILVRHNLHEQTVGSILGELWLVIEPILIALLNYILIVALLGVKGDDITFQYLMVSFCFWRLHSVMLENAPRLLYGRSDLLKHIGISVLMIVYEMVLTRLAYFLLSFAVTVGILALGGDFPGWSWLLLPVILLIQLIFTLSLTMLLAAIGTFVRDLSNVLSFLVAMWWYLSPGLYGVDRVPERFKMLFMLNPFTHFFPAYQGILFRHELPDFTPLAIIFVLSAALLVVSSWILIKVRYYFYKFL